VWEALAGLVRQSATFDTVKLQVNPPYSRYGHQTPKGDLPKDDGQREEVEEEEVADEIGDEEWEAKEEEGGVGECRER
jgi:hypothetical protein